MTPAPPTARAARPLPGVARPRSLPVLLGALLLLALLSPGPGPALASGAPGTDETATAAVTGRAAAADRRTRFVRERVAKGARDSSPADIAHVRELQYRLTWAGAYDGPVTGYFGDLTEAAVRGYQARERLPVTGEADRRTWRRLIPDSTRGRRKVPAACADGTGWDACYDRARHQVTLWRDGQLRNAWLVRGGAKDLQTRTGDFSVYYRDVDHVSSLYGSPMPYSQFFSGGQAFHGSTAMLDPFTGHSHGCINMYVEDARQLWRLTADHDLDVHVHGRWS